MTRYIIFLLANLISLFVCSQDSKSYLKLGLTTGFATYSFKNLDDLNDEVINQLPFDVAVIDNFPSRPYFGGHILVRLTDWYHAGPAYEFHSTGSRIGTRDYSGSYHFDQILSTHQLGIENEIQISRGNKPSVFLNIKGGVNFSDWKMEEDLTTGEEKQEDKSEFVAIKPFIYPAFKVSYPIYADFSVFGKAGYLFDLGGKYHLSGNTDYQSTLKVPWSGFRIALGLEFNVN